MRRRFSHFKLLIRIRQYWNTVLTNITNYIHQYIYIYTTDGSKTIALIDLAFDFCRWKWRGVILSGGAGGVEDSLRRRRRSIAEDTKEHLFVVIRSGGNVLRTGAGRVGESFGKKGHFSGKVKCGKCRNFTRKWEELGLTLRDCYVYLIIVRFISLSDFENVYFSLFF